VVKKFHRSEIFVAPGFNPGEKNKNKKCPRDSDDESDQVFRTPACCRQGIEITTKKKLQE
jgi:hypothetical protein